MTEPIRAIKAETWFVDTEYVPCIQTGRRVYGLDSTISDAEVLAIMYEQAGATVENPRPMLKSVMYRIVSIAAVIRTVNGETKLQLKSRPNDENFDERAILQGFLDLMGERLPQIVGYASSTFDIPTIFQRAVVLGIEAKAFCDRPHKPWDPAPDYFSSSNEWNIDLMRCLGGYGKALPKLVEIARACGIPAKVGGDGADVAQMWLDGRKREIVNYNECDALTTYLLWLHTARTCGLLSGEEVEQEGLLLCDLLEKQKEEKPHLQEFLDQWRSLQFLGAAPQDKPLTPESRKQLEKDAWDQLIIYQIGDEADAIRSIGGRSIDQLSDAELQRIIDRRGQPEEEVQHAAAK